MIQFSLLPVFAIYSATYYTKNFSGELSTFGSGATYLSLYQAYILHKYGPTADVKEFMIAFMYAVYYLSLSNYDLWLRLYPFFFFQMLIIVNI